MREKTAGCSCVELSSASRSLGKSQCIRVGYFNVLSASISRRFVLRLKLMSGDALFPNISGKSGSNRATSSRFSAAFIA